MWIYIVVYHLFVTSLLQEVIFRQHLFVCLSGCEQHYSKRDEWIVMKFYVRVQGGTMLNWLNFGGNLDLLTWVNERKMFKIGKLGVCLGFLTSSDIILSFGWSWACLIKVIILSDMSLSSKLRVHLGFLLSPDIFQSCSMTWSRCR